MRMDDFTDEEILEASAGESKISQVLNNLGIHYNNGSVRKQIYDRLDSLGVSFKRPSYQRKFKPLKPNDPGPLPMPSELLPARPRRNIERPLTPSEGSVLLRHVEKEIEVLEEKLEKLKDFAETIRSW
jgi:hypothetical protein